MSADNRIVVAVFLIDDKNRNLEFRVSHVCGDIYYDCEIDYVKLVDSLINSEIYITRDKALESAVLLNESLNPEYGIEFVDLKMTWNKTMLKALEGIAYDLEFYKDDEIISDDLLSLKKQILNYYV